MSDAGENLSTTFRVFICGEEPRSKNSNSCWACTPASVEDRRKIFGENLGRLLSVNTFERKIK